MSASGWIGVDLDGTLAKYDGWKGVEHIGEPIPLMVERVKRWLDEGKAVKIFTARVWDGADDGRDVAKVRDLIEAWCEKHIGQRLPVTNVKDWEMIELWDDRCVPVLVNSGLALRLFHDECGNPAVKRED